MTVYKNTYLTLEKQITEEKDINKKEELRERYDVINAINMKYIFDEKYFLNVH